ncbi:hypothetical protein [Desulfosoma sp.]
MEPAEKTSPLEHVPVPGFTEAGVRLPQTLRILVRERNLLAYKEATPLLWVFFMGGTGTGKSTVFDAVCGVAVSAVGAERPKTSGAIGFVHEKAPLEKGFPFSEFGFVKHEGRSVLRESPLVGEPGVIHLWLHDRADLANVVFMDTPDVDSVAASNRTLVETLWRLADVVVFVTSQEKYADDVPSRFLQRIVHESTDVLVVCNKVGADTREDDVRDILDRETRVPAGSLWLFPFLPSNPVEALKAVPAFLEFSDALKTTISGPDVIERRARWMARRKKALAEGVRTALDVVTTEVLEAHRWKEKLRRYADEAVSQIIADQEGHFSSETRSYLQAEIRALFSRYDVLAGPRRWIARLVTAPLRFLGLTTSRPYPDRREVLERIKHRIHLGGIQAAVQRYGRRILEETLPDQGESPLCGAVMRQGVIMSPEEVADHVYRKQEQLIQWLEKVFMELARDIPKGTKWGIYSTSVLWGVLILSLEVAVGGGLSMVEAVLDAAIAPFVTKGAVELFAYAEIQKIARQLGEKYRASLISVVDEQRRRFEACLDPLLPPSEVVDSLRRWAESALDGR